MTRHLFLFLFFFIAWSLVHRWRLVTVLFSFSVFPAQSKFLMNLIIIWVWAGNRQKKKEEQWESASYFLWIHDRISLPFLLMYVPVMNDFKENGGALLSLLIFCACPGPIFLIYLYIFIVYGPGLLQKIREKEDKVSLLHLYLF